MLSVAVVLVVVGGGVLFIRRRTRRMATAAGAGAAQERRDLVIRIAALDECFAAGEVGRAEYQAQRRLAKHRLQELTAERA